jgi:hypothetical protein
MKTYEETKVKLENKSTYIGVVSSSVKSVHPLKYLKANAHKLMNYKYSKIMKLIY